MNSPSLASKIGAQCPKALTTHVIQWLDSCVISLLKCGLLLQHDFTKVVAVFKGIIEFIRLKSQLGGNCCPISVTAPFADGLSKPLKQRPLFYSFWILRK